MLTPLPPGSVRLSLARCLKPVWKLGTVSVLSTAALGVTVMITWTSRERFSWPSYESRRTARAGLVSGTV